MNPHDWQQTGEYVTFGGVRVFVTARGMGRNVLVLHGFPTASYDFSRVAPLLADRYRLLLFDYPGFGFSDKPRDFTYSLFTYADAAEAVAAHFGVQRVALLAHDIGDSVALELLRRGTLSIEQVVLLNGSVWSIPFADWRMRALQRLLLHPVGGALVSQLRLFRKGVFTRNFNRIVAQPLPAAELDAFWSLIAYNDGPRIYHRLIRYMHERWQHQQQWSDALATHPAPLMLIWGQADPIATPQVADIVRQYRPDTAYVPLHNVGHYPQWEAGQQVADTVKEAFS